jgi:sulfonate transport system permease protein
MTELATVPTNTQDPTTPDPPVQDQPRPVGEVDDLSPGHGRRRHRRSTRQWPRIAFRVLGPLAVLAVWQATSTFGLVSESVLSSTVVAAFRELWSTGDLQAALPISLQRAGQGFAIGASIGLFFGLLAGLWRLGEELLDASLQMLRTIPFIALIPLFMLWFGIDEKAKIALISAACIFPVYLNTYAGVRGVDPKVVEAGTVFGLRRWSLIRHIVLPLALPSVLVGVRYGLGVSLLALVAAEQINASSGIGYIVINANQQARPDIVIAGVLVYSVLGIVVDVFVRLIERLALPWRPKFVTR